MSERSIDPLPEDAKPIGTEEAKVVASAISRMIVPTPAPIEGVPNRVMFGPSPSFVARALRGGIELYDVEDGFEDENIVDKTMLELIHDECIYWGADDEYSILPFFRAPYTTKNRW